MNSPNRSTAVMARRKEPPDSLDYFPTPAWATRALLENCIKIDGLTVWEPACGEGYMSRVLAERAKRVIASDVHHYGWDHILHDFLMPFVPDDVIPHWVITNPPFRLAEQFVNRGLQVARIGVAVLVRSAFAESVQRYEELFRDKAPTIIAQFVERVPMVKGKVDEDATSATAYCWMVWERQPRTQMMWIPPCRAKLERACDYAAMTDPPVEQSPLSREPLQ